MWSDFDVIWLKPMDHLSKITERSDFGATICPLKKIHHNISILVSVPQHPLYKFVIDKCNSIQASLKSKPDHQEFGTVMWNRIFPDLSGASILEDYLDVVCLEYFTFFPYSIYKMDGLYHRTDLSVLNDKVMCVHWFNGHELSKQYVNGNGFNRGCSMTKLIEQTGFADNLGD